MRHLPFFRLMSRFLIACLTLAFFTGQAHADALPAFTMPKVAPWPTRIKPMPAGIEEKDLPAVTAKAEAGDTDAQLQLVSYYSEYSDSTYKPRDMARAKAWAKKAAEAGNDYALYAEAFLGNEGPMPREDTLPLLEKAANAGSGFAAYHLGTYYQEDQHKKTDKAIVWLRKAVEKGHPFAALALAEIYFPMSSRRPLIQPDIVTGYAWRILAQRGIEDMAATAGDTRKNDLKTNREQLVMMQFFLMPSEKKQALALVAAWPSQLPPVGNTAPFSEEKSTRHGQPLSPEAAEALYQSAMNGGKAEIDAFISAFFTGRLNADEKERLLPVLIKGNALGVAQATNLLAWAYIDGRIVEKNEEKGYRMLQTQADKGDAKACYFLGMLAREKGGSNEADRKKVLSWFEKGAARGDTGSMHFMARYYEENNDPKKAAAWYEKAAKAGDDNALMALLGMAESNRNVAALGKWMGIIILRASDPMIVYRSRAMLMWVANSMSWADYQKILMEAEKWHKANPLPKKRPGAVVEG